MKKIRVNITVDKATLEKAKTKLNLFGGKLSTLFNAYLNDFVESMDKRGDENIKQLNEEIKILRERVEKLEKKK
jgi:predicted ribosome quality control (RQC) complex YloA/Tae2 family protein